MGTEAGQAGPLWPLGVYFIAALLNVAGMILVSYVLGQRHQGRETGQPYESGILSTGSAHGRFDIRFYLIALFFVIFDLEAVFVFAWAIGLRSLIEQGLGWVSYGEMLVFVGILLAGLIYLWRLGALDWGPQPRWVRPRQPSREQPETHRPPQARTVASQAMPE